jgi:hypothetical protein
MPWEKTVGEARPAITATNIAAIVFFICLFSLIIFFRCANEPFARGFPCGRRSGGAPGRRLINLARVGLWQTATESVNTIFASRRFQFHKGGQFFI